MNANFCFSELLILREKKRFADFRLEIEITNFQKILKRHHTGKLHKKGTILHQAPQITLFFDSPCMLSIILATSRPTCVQLNIRAGPTFAVLLWTVPPIYNYLSGRGV